MWFCLKRSAKKKQIQPGFYHPSFDPCPGEAPGSFNKEMQRKAMAVAAMAIPPKKCRKAKSC